MRKLILTVAILFVTFISFGQDPLINSWMINTTGVASYNVGSGVVTMTDSADVTKVCYNTTHVYVVAEGLANYTMGPFTGNPNTPSGQNFIWKIKRTPVAATTTFTDQPTTGPIAVAINGCKMYGISDAKSYSSSTGTNTSSGDGLWHTDAWVSEGSTMDANGNGHPDQSGNYHYHANPITFYTDPSTVHSPIIGWALDGYPIYGPYGYSNPLSATSGVTRMTSSYQLRNITTRTTLPDGTTSSPPGPVVSTTFPLGTYMEDYEYISGLGTLDEHNGRYCVTPDYPSGTYAYFIATDSNGDPDYPYIMGETYYGEITTPEIMNSYQATIPSSGMTCYNVNSACVASISSSTDASCFGTSDGSATVSVSGFTSPSYSWVNSSSTVVSTSATATGLAAGDYTVTVTDGSCSESGTVTISQPNAISITNTTTNVLCNGGSTGAINVEVSGGTPNGSASPGLLISEVAANPAGTDSPFEFVELIATKSIDFSTDPYTVIFTNNGTATTSGWIQGGAISYAFEISSGSVDAGDVVYVGGSSMIPTTNILRSINTGTTGGDGAIGVSNTNGVLGNGDPNADAVGVFASDVSSITNSTVPVDAIFYGTSAGSAVVSSGTAGYQLPVNDKYSGGKLQTTSFLAPNAVSANYLKATGTYDLQTNTYTTPRTWANTSTFTNGTSSVSLTNPYTYSWSNSSTAQDLTGLTSGTYTVTVTDGDACTATSVINVTQPTAISLSSTTTSASCSTNNGSINLTVSGGTGAYTYLWSNGATTQDISSLAAGNYSVTVTDANNCTATSTVTVGSTSGLALSTSVTSVLCNGGSTGAVDLSVSGGSGTYTYLWSNGATTQDLSSVAAATYSVTVSDGSGCSATTSATVTQPASALSASATATAVLCNGGSTGSVNLTVTGGTTGYTYVWSNASTTEDLSGVAAGTYSVTVTDANACTATASATVTQPTALSLSTVNTNVTCNGASTGAVNLTVSGGTSGYTYLWSNSATTQDISSLASGTYTVTVTDANACTASTSATITQPTAIALSSTTTNASCSSSNGSINLTVSGGTGTYTYLWSNSATTQDISSLAAGNYTVTVTDANSCTATSTITVGSASGLTLSTTATNVLCNGNSTGAVNLTVTGGTPGYTYLWTNSATTEDISSLAAGTYSVTVTDNGGCTASSSVTITQPTALSASAVATAVSCNGGTNGSVNLTVTGGTAAYTYVWSNATTLEDPANLAAGTYSVTVTDANNCTTTTSTTVTEPTAISLSTINTNVLCNGSSTGAVNLTATGGTGSYTYDWSNTSTTEDISGLSAGTYSVTVEDANGCSATATTTITQPAVLALTTTVTHVSTCNGSNGAVNLVVSGGTAGYTYVWSNTQVTEDISGLTGGTYSVTVTDANNCTATTSAVINEPSAFTLSSAQTQVDCNGDNTGAINLTVTGGTSPFTYSWDSGQTIEDITSLNAGTYEVTVTDNAGCTDVLSVTITEPTAINLSVTTTDEISGNDGAVNLSVTGGTPGYTYSWTGGQTTQDLSGLTAGSYTVTVTDANGCTETITATVGSQIGMEENSVAATVKIYPNPATDIINVEAITIPESIKIYSSEGKLVLMTSNSSTINIHELQRGIYIAEVTINGTIVKHKLVKQ